MRLAKRLRRISLRSGLVIKEAPPGFPGNSWEVRWEVMPDDAAKGAPKNHYKFE